MNWEPIRSRLLGTDLDDALKAATELREGIEIVHTVEFPLMLSALLPAFSTILANSNEPKNSTAERSGGRSNAFAKNEQLQSSLPDQATPSTTSNIKLQQQQHEHHQHYQLRNTILEIISRMPSNEVLRPHAPHLVAVALDVLIHRRDYEENALLASRIIFDLYKAYRTLPQDYIQPALDFVISAYKNLPGAVQRSFSFQALSVPDSILNKDTVDAHSGDGKSESLLEQIDRKIVNQTSSSQMDTTTSAKISSPPFKMTTTSTAKNNTTGKNTEISQSFPFRHISMFPRSNTSFRVLTEWPLIVMLMFQLYPKFLKGNIPLLIQVMMEALSLRSPTIDFIEKQRQQIQQPHLAITNVIDESRLRQFHLDDAAKRVYFSKSRELVAAQAKTLSFLTYLLRGFSNELMPYEDRLASNVVAIMSTCPRELLSTRKELLVATRHLLNSEFRSGFFRHVDSLLDEKILVGWSSKHQRHLCYHYSEQTVLRPLGYAALSDLIQHVRATPALSMSQISRVVSLFSQVLHDESLPMSTQYMAVRTLLSVLDTVFSNKNRNPQLGRDLLVRILRTLVEKLSTLHQCNSSDGNRSRTESTNTLALAEEVTVENVRKENCGIGNFGSNRDYHFSLEIKDEPLRDKKCIVRAIVVGTKTLIWYINNYRVQREKEVDNIQPPRTGVNNEEIYSGLSKITQTEHSLIAKYIELGIPCIKVLKERGEEPDLRTGAVMPGERQAPEQFRDTLTYFAAAFTTFDGYDLRRILGRKLDVLVQAIKDDPTAIVVPRHLLSANVSTSYEFCNMMLNFLVKRMDHLALTKGENIYFVSLSSEDYNGASRLEVIQSGVEEQKNLDEEDMKKSSSAYLQLFERILKSLSSYPENERALRPHLKKIVSTCLRSSLEKTEVKADNYCMLLRYVFRSISAGKFEDSYRELLPLIPAVLNGLFRVLCSTDDTTLCHTLIELVLTIPARLSSLLPHMNLLLRVIVLALESNSDDLVNLGLRTLEFWVDNLNPEFLFPELSKQKNVFVNLMKALSLHLRPAPYPYGLLTLRLLGKLGGKNRRVLREPMDIEDIKTSSESSVEQIGLDFMWSATARKTFMEIDAPENDSTQKLMFKIHLPIQRCLKLLKRISYVKILDPELTTLTENLSSEDMSTANEKNLKKWQDVSVLLSKNTGDIDLHLYCKEVMQETNMSQAKAAIQVLRSSLTNIIDIPKYNLEEIDIRGISNFNENQIKKENGTFDMQTVAKSLAKYNLEFHTIAIGLMYGCSLPSIGEKELAFVKGLLTSIYVIITSNQRNIVRVDANGSPLRQSDAKLPERDEFGEDGLGSLKPFGYFELNGPLKYKTDPLTINRSLAEFLSEHSPKLVLVGLDLLNHVLKLPTILGVSNSNEKVKTAADKLDRGSMIYFENLLSSLCEHCVSSKWNRRSGLYTAIITTVETLGSSWGRKYEIEIMYVALYSVKSAPSEMSIAGIKSFEFLVRICSILYGNPSISQNDDDCAPLVVDILSLLKKPRAKKSPEIPYVVINPCEDVIHMLLSEMASTNHLVRAAARFVFDQYFMRSMTKADAKGKLGKHMTLIRRILFSRSLRLLPLQEQVGAVEALTVLVDQVPLIQLEDQHLLAFLSELLKMASVADGEMTDTNLIGSVVDRNGYVLPAQSRQSADGGTREDGSAVRPSSLFLRRDCILITDSYKLLIEEELPLGVQLRVSSIRLFRSIISGHPGTFFDAETSTPVGNIRPHVISLLFRSLVSQPIQSVTAAHDALRDVLTLSVVELNIPEGGFKSKSRLRKELLQTCIRPVLLNLRDCTRLSTCLLRGLSQLLSLLSSWFNKTLGEKLLDHIQKFTDPKRIRSQRIWKEGSEPEVAAAIVDLFTLLPHASNFVDPLVKTTIKLEACLPAYKSRHVYSPYRKPLAKYLNKYSQYTVAFFLQRLKTPLYTELFQDIVKLKESSQLRDYLSGRKCSVSLLNISFERPLEIIRSVKATYASGSSPASTKSLKNGSYLTLHGIQPYPGPQNQVNVMLQHDLELKERKLRIFQEELVKAKENLQSKGISGSGKSSLPEAKAAFDDAKRRHKVAKVSFDKVIKEVADIKRRCAAGIEKAKNVDVPDSKNPDAPRPMTIDSLELQYQGFCLIETLFKYDPSYLKQDNDVLRALRWLWRSKGRFLRMQHEESIPPRYQGESKILASFLVGYSKNSPDDVDLLFELIRIFLQPPTSDFLFVESFLKDTSARGLQNSQKQQIMERFFVLMAGESTEEIKSLSLQLVIYPMLYASFETMVSKPSANFTTITDKNENLSISLKKTLIFFSASDVQKFVTDVLFQNENINPCGERLKIAFLQMADLLLQFIPHDFGEKGKYLVKFCWSLLKSDDSSCKNWAYVVLCRYINVLGTSQNTILQVYFDLLRFYQQEGKDLIRIALNLLVSALPKKLDKTGFKTAIDNTYQVMFEEGNSVPQLAHVWYIVVHHPDIFSHRRSELARYMISSLNRLGLPPNSLAENRILSLSIVDLVLKWEKDKGEKEKYGVEIPAEQLDVLNDSQFQLDKSMVETMVNFLIRFKILLADPKVDTTSVDVDFKFDILLRDIIGRWKGSVIRPAYLEKVVLMCKEDEEYKRTKAKNKSGGDTDKTESKHRKQSIPTCSKDDDAKKPITGLPDVLSCCLDIFLVLVEEDPQNAFLMDNPSQLKVILSSCFRYSRFPSETSIRKRLETFLVSFLSLRPHADQRIAQPLTVWLEKYLIDAEIEYRSTNGHSQLDSSRQARFRQSLPSDRSVDCAVLFSLGIIKQVGRASHSFSNFFTSSLLLLLGTIIKKHTLQAAAKQKQNGVAYNSQAGTISIRQMYSTPISGILQETCSESTLSSSAGISRVVQGKQSDLYKELKDFNYMLQSAVAILEIIGDGDSAYLFSNNRKSLLSLLQSIFDMSNNVQLLLTAVRIVGDWLVAGSSGPLTMKERNSFLWKVSSFDFNGLSDVLSQPLADLVCYYMSTLVSNSGLKNHTYNGEDIIISRSLAACLLTANNCARKKMISLFQKSATNSIMEDRQPEDILWQLFHSDFEGLGGRNWVVVFVEMLLGNVVPAVKDTLSSSSHHDNLNARRKLPHLIQGKEVANNAVLNPLIQSSYINFKEVLQFEHSNLKGEEGTKCLLVDALCHLAHGDSLICQSLMQTLLPASWNNTSSVSLKLYLVSAMESFLSRPFHSQTFKKEINGKTLLPNAVKSFLSCVVCLEPLPDCDIDLLITLAKNYNCWYEVLFILENYFLVYSSSSSFLSKDGKSQYDKILLAMRHCYRLLGETQIWTSLALKSCCLPDSSYAASLEIYGKVGKALEAYTGLVDLVESKESTNASNFEMDFWEERWVHLQQQEQQLDVVLEYAKESKNEVVMLECAWRQRDWDSVRSLCISPSIITAIEAGDPAMKICETLSAVADGKLGDVENLHAQSSQMALYKWQNLPKFSAGSTAHAKLFHIFHRLVEIRESGQIMVETNNHSAVKTLPDLKNLLNAWRHRLPNDEEDLTVWDEIFTWRAHMFHAILSNFHWSEPSTLATLHDRPWTAIRMAMVARKQDLKQTAFLLLNRITDSRAMDVSDVYLKLREQILLYNNPECELERTGGLNLINTTNLSFFDSSQKSELFRLRAIYLASLRRTSKSNQAYCHSVQICPKHTKSWISWGGLCSSLGSMTEKQAEQARASRADNISKVDSTKKVAQYLAQAMGCFIEAIQIDPNEKARIHLPRCLWMLTKDGSSPGVLCQTLENRGTKLPPWVWLPWIPQLLTGLCRLEGRAIKSLLSRVIKAYPQAAYYSLRAFYLERRDVERAKGGVGSNVVPGQHMGSVAYAEEMMSTLRRSHASLWSSLEAILEELIVKFRPSYEEELLATISALLERAESHAEKQTVPDKKRIEDEEAMVNSWSKTLSRIAAKFFRETDSTSSSARRDERVKKTSDFKRKYKADFERDFKVASPEVEQGTSPSNPKTLFRLTEYITLLQQWKDKLEIQVSRTPGSLPLIESSQSLAMFSGNIPNLWPGSCDTRYSYGYDRNGSDDDQVAGTATSASSSAVIARKAAIGAALTTAKLAAREGIGGEYGGGSSSIEIPGQYCPNSSSSADIKPCPELHAKLIKFEPRVQVLRRNDQLVRRCGMVGSDGRTYNFLLQFAIPYWTRTDERTAQTSYIIDKFLRRNIISARNYISMQPTAAIPVAQRLRMTPDPDSRLALDEVWRGCRHEKITGKSVADLISKELAVRLEKDSRDVSEEEQKLVEKKVRLQVYKDICGSMADNRILLRYLLLVLDGPENFYLFRRSFTVQLAANSLLQYVFSVAERTPQRFVFLHSNGKVLSPDFRVSYSNQGFIEDFNEVPYRMTPNIEKAIGESHLQGIFVRSMAMISGAVKEHKEEFDPILRLLMRDDILAWYSKSLAKTDSKILELERFLIERVSKNVHTLQSRFSECSPKMIQNSNDRKKGTTTKKSETDADLPLALDKRANELLQVATDPEKLCMTRVSYVGWF